MPLDRALMRITWAEFRAVELYQPPATLSEAPPLATMLDAAQVTLAALDAGTLAGETAQVALDSAAHIGRCAVLAGDLGANRVVCDLGPISEPLTQDTVAQLLQALIDVPVLLCLRNRPDDGPEIRDRLLRLVGAFPDRLGLALDPGAAQRAGWDPVEAWPLLAPSVRHFYATDAVGSRPARLGAGDVRWEELAEQVKESGYSGALTLWAEPGQAFSDPVFAEAELKEARFLLESWFYGAE